MKICYEWLKEYIDIDKSPQELADDLTLFGHEVEKIDKVDGFSVLDFEITPNRGDLLSIYGMAREVGALYGLSLKKPEIKIETGNIKKTIKVNIADSKICPRYTARVIDNVEIKESSQHIKDYLATYGFRPVNNIVDITNFAMLATGQPLHAFDYDKIKDGEMNIRLSKTSEEVMTLDGKNHSLDDKTIIISDKEKIYDLAGIMGGYRSEIDENTKTIILQGSIFDPVLIRKASKRLKHLTDASYRYERGVDFCGTTYGVDLATKLILESCPDAKAGELIDIKEKEYDPKKIELDLQKVNRLIGIDIDTETAKKYLEQLGFKISGNVVSVPSYRAYDVKIWQDIAEEIARMYSYNKIPKNKIDTINEEIKDSNWREREKIKDVLKEIGFSEVYSYSFADKEKIKLLGNNLENCVETANPIAPELKYLRPTLLVSILAQIAKNPWAPEIDIFEMEKVFENEDEKWQLAIATVGKNKKTLFKALEGLNLQEKIEEIDKNTLDVFKIRRPVFCAIYDVDDINIGGQKEINNEISKNKYRHLSKFPPTVRDLAFIVDNNIDNSNIEKEISNSSEDILLVELFDEFSSDKFGQNKKNIAFHIWLQNMNRPMEDQEVNKTIETIVSLIESKFQATLRK